MLCTCLLIALSSQVLHTKQSLSEEVNFINMVHDAQKVRIYHFPDLNLLLTDTVKGSVPLSLSMVNT